MTRRLITFTARTLAFLDDVLVCGECGALVLDDDTDRHADWHMAMPTPGTFRTMGTAP